jgi:adenine-specific DNA-methyltransferase
MDKEQKITNDIKVPNKDLEVLKKHFSHCFDKNGNFDFEKFKQQLSENEIDFYKESYGMDWLGKSYARLLASDSATTLLKEDEKFNSREKNKNSENLLIKGDNLEVLKHLSNAYYEKVKMIYIDPPYNTGSDGFVYQDDRKFTVNEFRQLAGVDEEKAKRILSFVSSKSNSHSAWLTFMYPRLYIAKQLLREDGVIFVSIDDNEVAQLRLLMDEIFGEENFRGDIVRATGTTTGQEALKIGSSYDSCLCYAKSAQFELKGIPLKGKDLNRFNNDDNDGKGKYALLQLRKTGNADRKEDREGMFFPIEAPDGSLVFPIGPTDYLSRWRTGKKKFQTFLDEGLIVWKKNGDDIEEFDDYEEENGDDVSDYSEITNENVDISKYKSTWKPYVKYYLSDRTKQVSNLWIDIDGNKKGSIELKELFEKKKLFENPKPTDFINRMLTISCNSYDLILDFFAGSGTTGDAVMQLNAEDGGNRKYILVQLPEPIDPKKNKTAYDFVKNELKAEEPTIFEITKERLIRASKKIQEETIKTKIAEKQKEIKELEGQLDIDGKDEKVKQLKAEIKALKNQDLGFKVFETMPIWEDYNFEADELDPKLSLFDESKLTEDDLKALLITWKTYDGVPLTESLQEIDLGKYTACYTSDKLYLINKGFKTENLKTLLEKIDGDKEFNPTSIIAFGYHFESKNLREIAENIKSYANKKNIDIDFITRY